MIGVIIREAGQWDVPDDGSDGRRMNGDWRG